MSLTNRFLPHSVDLTGGVALWISQIERTSIEPGVVLIEESSGSQVDREFVSTREVAPTFPFTTTDLTVLSTVGFNGVPLIAGATTFTAYGRELPFGATPTAQATTNHLKLVCTDGLLVPVGIHAAHNQSAKLSMMLIGTTGSGGLTPFALSASQAIPTGDAQVANVYAAGPTKYTVSGGASRLVQGITDNAVNFGIQAFREGDSSEVYPSHVSIISRRPTIEFTTRDTELITEIGNGVAVSAFSTYFRKFLVEGQRVVPATASHVSVGGTSGMIKPGGTTLTHMQPGSSLFTFTPQLNTTLIVITVGVAIPIT